MAINAGTGTGRVGVKHLSNYFGRLPGQSLKDFAAECKALPDVDFYALVSGIESKTLTYV